MESESIRCNNCGAPLEVPIRARFVKCSHCDTQLAVKRTSSVTYTEISEKIDQQTQKLSEKIDQLTIENRMMHLDHDWERKRDTFMMTQKNGSQYLPTEISSIFSGVIAAGFGLFWIMLTSSMQAPFFFPLFGIAFMAIGIGISVVGYQKSQAYRKALKNYKRHRRNLMSERSQISSDNSGNVLDDSDSSR